MWRSIDHPIPTVNLDFDLNGERHYLSQHDTSYHHEPVDMADFHNFRNDLNMSLNATKDQPNGIENMTPRNPQAIKYVNDKSKNKRTPRQPAGASLGL